MPRQRKGGDKPYTRRDFIDDAVQAYIRNNPVEYQDFRDAVKERRKVLFDEKFGQVKSVINGEVKVSEEEHRLVLSIPEKLYSTFQTIFRADGTPFGEEEGEFAWFCNKYKEFLVPDKY